MHFAGGYDKEEKAARAYDLAALKYWGTTTTTNFPVSFHFICFFFFYSALFSVFPFNKLRDMLHIYILVSLCNMKKFPHLMECVCL